MTSPAATTSTIPAAPLPLRLSAAAAALLGLIAAGFAVAMMVDYAVSTSTDPLAGLAIILGVPLLVIGLLTMALTFPATRRADRTSARVRAAVGAVVLLLPVTLLSAGSLVAIPVACVPLALLVTCVWPRRDARHVAASPP